MNKLSSLADTAIELTAQRSLLDRMLTDEEEEFDSLFVDRWQLYDPVVGNYYLLACSPETDAVQLEDKPAD